MTNREYAGQLRGCHARNGSHLRSRLFGIDTYVDEDLCPRGNVIVFQNAGHPSRTRFSMRYQEYERLVHPKVLPHLANDPSRRPR
jgi:hypothetical protein